MPKKPTDKVRAGQIKQAHKHLLTLGDLVVRFARVERMPRYPDGARETDVEHSYHLALSAIELAPLLYPDLDVGLVAQFSLVHDLPEVYTGDVSTFNITPEQLADKKHAEEQATQRLLSELPPYTANLLKRYEEQVEPEARFVRFVDKLLPAIILTMAGPASTFVEDYGLSTAAHLQTKRTEHLARLQTMFPDFDIAKTLSVIVWDAEVKRVFAEELTI